MAMRLDVSQAGMIGSDGKLIDKSITENLKKLVEEVVLKDLKSMMNKLNAPADLKKRLDWIFGGSSQDVVNKVKKIIKEMHDVANRAVTITPKFNFGDKANLGRINAKEIERDYAHVYPNDVNPMQAGQLFIYFNPLFLPEVEDGLNNRYLTLIHEFSHLCSKTDDYAYADDCFWNDGDRLAKKKTVDGKKYTTDEAINNADCYGYFMAATFARENGCVFP